MGRHAIESDEVYLTPKELAERYRDTISPRTLANWRSQKVGPSYVKIGGRVLYSLSSVIAWEMTRHVVARVGSLICFKAALVKPALFGLSLFHVLVRWL
jgi:Helix-turn-helix domain